MREGETNKLHNDTHRHIEPNKTKHQAEAASLPTMDSRDRDRDRDRQTDREMR